MLYNCLKIIHILGAALLLISIMYSIHLWLTRAHSVAKICDQILYQTWSIIIPFALFQLITGFTMISLQHYDISKLWVSGSIIGFISTIASWFIFIYFLLSAQTHSNPAPRGLFYRRLQGAMLLVCTSSIVSMIFFMANKI